MPKTALPRQSLPFHAATFCCQRVDTQHNICAFSIGIDSTSFISVACVSVHTQIQRKKAKKTAPVPTISKTFKSCTKKKIHTTATTPHRKKSHLFQDISICTFCRMFFILHIFRFTRTHNNVNVVSLSYALFTVGFSNDLRNFYLL